MCAHRCLFADHSHRCVVAAQLKGLQSKAKSAAKSVGSNPAQDFANKGKKAVSQAKPAVNKAKVLVVRCNTISCSAGLPHVTGGCVGVHHSATGH